MASPINTAVMPGDNMDPDAIDAGATTLRTAGSNVSTQGATVQTSWQKISTVYDAPEEQTLFSAMDPAKVAAEAFGSDMGSVAAALGTFAEEVRTIKKAVAAIRADAATFLGTITDGKVSKTTVSRAGVHKSQVDWDSEQDSVDANNALIHRTNDQQEALWAAERKCANAINDVFGAAHISATSESNPNGYGYDDLPDNTEGLPWGAAVERKESCGESVVKGVFVDGLWNGMVQGITGLVGLTWTGPKGLDWSWENAGNSWSGLAKFGVGLVATGPLGFAAGFIPGPVGDYVRDSQKTVANFVTGLVAIDLYADDPFHKWKENGFRAFGEALFNVGTLPIGVLKIGNAGKVGLAAKASEVASTAAKLTDPLALAGKAAQVLKGPTMEVLSKLFKGADLDSVIKVGSDVKIDIPSVRTGDLGGDVPNMAGKDPVDAPPPRDPSAGDSTPHAPDTTPSHGGQPDVPATNHTPGTGDHSPSAGDHTPGTGDHAPGSGDHTPGTGDHAPGSGDHTPGSGDHTPGPGDHAPAAGDHSPASGDHPGAGHGPDGNGLGTAESPRRYEYSNPAESLRHAEQPTAGELSEVGSAKRYEAGSPEHMTARWRDYQERGGPMDWDHWRDTYVRNQGHHARGAAYEQAFWDTRHFSPEDYSRNAYVPGDTGVRRNYDILSTGDDLSAYELKSGPEIDKAQLAKDKIVADAGWDVTYVFGKEPSPAVIKALDDAGIQWEVFHGQPVLVNAK